MSALGHKRTCRESVSCDVRFTPKADIERRGLGKMSAKCQQQTWLNPEFQVLLS